MFHCVPRKSTGFSLIEVLVAVAVMSIISLALVSMLSNVLDGQKMVVRRYDVMNLQNTLRARLMQDTFCRCNFGIASGTVIRFASSAIPAEIPVTPTEALYEVNSACVKSAMVVGKGMEVSPQLFAQKIVFNNIKPAGPRNFSATLKVDFNSTQGFALKPVEVAGITLSTSPYPPLGPNGVQVNTCMPTQLLPLTRMVRFDSAGAHSWTVPAEVTQIIVEAWGAGGGGGGSRWWSGDSTGGGGGAGGNYVKAVLLVVPGQVLNINVGAGGSGGAGGDGSTNAAFGVNGGPTQVTIPTASIIIKADGGEGGQGGREDPPGNTRESRGGPPGPDDQCTGCSSFVVLKGQRGGTAVYNYSSTRGALGGVGGSSPNGGQGGAVEADGMSFGGGGGGASVWKPDFGPQPGRAGAAGGVVITY